MVAIQIFIDSHVHFYPCYDPLVFFQSAFRNTNTLTVRNGISSGVPRILCFTESSDHRFFNQWLEMAKRGEAVAGFEARVIAGDGPELIELKSGEERLWLLPGRQINADNGLEVSAFGLLHPIPEGGSLEAIVSAVLAQDAVPALPWGVGKWFGHRGEEVQQCLDRFGDRLGVSDNSNRPVFWPMPKLLKPAVASASLLAGSDPLPLVSAQSAVGRYGTIVTTDELPGDGRQVLALLSPSATEARKILGSRESGLTFLFNQISMQIRKRSAK